MNETKHGRIYRWGRKLKRWLSIFVLYPDEVPSAIFKYSKAVETFLRTVRFLALLVLLSFILFGYLLVYHAMNAETSATSICKLNIPCIMLFSSFGDFEKNTFSVTLTLFLLLISVATYVFWNDFKLRHHVKTIYQNKKTDFSRFVFSSWKWDNRDLLHAKVTSERLTEVMCRGIDQIDQNRVAEPKNWKKVLLSYLISWGITSLIILVYWAVIGVIYLVPGIANTNQTNKTETDILDLMLAFLVPLMVAACNYWFPYGIAFIAYLYKGKTEKQTYNQYIYRYFAGKWFGYGFILWLNYHFVLQGNSVKEAFSLGETNIGIKLFFKGCPGESALVTDTTGLSPLKEGTYFHCPEDEIAFNLLTLLICEFIFSKLVDLSIHFYQKLFKKAKSREIRRPFDPFIHFADFFMLFAVSVYGVMFSPYFIFFILVLIFAEYRYLVFKMKRLRSQTLLNSYEEEWGSAMLMMLAVGTVLLAVYILFYLVVQIDRNNYLEVVG